MSYSNQKIVRIGNREKRDAQHIYSTMNIEAMQEAMMELKGETFKLWCYLNKNQEGYQFELSQKECEKWGIKKDTYYAAVKKLVELRYLVPIEEGSNIYVFFELRHSEIQKNQVIENSEIQKFSEIQKNQVIENSEIQKTAQIDFSEIQKNFSEIPQRNNTYNNTNYNVKDNTNNKIEERIKEEIKERLEERGAATPPASAEISEIQKKAENAETKTQEEPRHSEETTINYWNRSELGVIGEIDNEKDLIAYLEILFGGQLTSKVKGQLQVALKTMSAKQIARFYFYCDQKEHRNFLKCSQMTLGLLQFDDIKERANTYWTNFDNRKKQFAKDYNLWQLDQKEIIVKIPQKRPTKRRAYTKEEIEAMA